MKNKTDDRPTGVRTRVGARAVMAVTITLGEWIGQQD
jgi:hypothetical protein